MYKNCHVCVSDAVDNALDVLVTSSKPGKAINAKMLSLNEKLNLVVDILTEFRGRFQNLDKKME